MKHHKAVITGLLAILFLHISMNSTAQNPLDMFDAETDTGYIRKFPKALTVKTYVKTKILSLGVEDHVGDYELNYEPNGHNSLGFSLNYKWIGFGFGFNVIDEAEIEKYGETSYFDFQTNFYLRKGTFDIFYQKYKGFYLENTAAMVADWPDEETYIIRPDIKVVSSGVNYTHVFNPEKFSYIASYSQTEMQQKSAGSVILGATINFHRATADSSFVPSRLEYDDAFLNNNISYVKGWTTNARFGYAHTLVALKRIFLSLSLDAGMSYVYSVFDETGNQRGRNFSVNPNVSFKLAAGYNHSRWFAGLTSSSFYHLNKTAGEDSYIRIIYGYVNFVVAHRFMLRKDISIPGFK